MSMSYTTLAVILTLVAVLFYGAFVLYGSWSNRPDGHGRAVRNKALHAHAADIGDVRAREDEKENEHHGSNRG